MSVSITMARSLDLNNISAAELLKHQTVPVKVRGSIFAHIGNILCYREPSVETNIHCDKSTAKY